jgi:maltokinase
MTSFTLAGLGEAVAGGLGSFLTGQRWFAGRGRQVVSLRPGPAERLVDGDPALVHLLVEVGYADGARERYQVPLGVGRRAPAGLPGAALVGPGGLVAWDALADPELTGRLLELVAAGAEVGGLRCVTGPGAAELLAGVDLGAARPLGAEQSNTSVVVDERLILKLFRQVVAGVNPELELTEALARHGFGAVAAPVGWVEAAAENAADPPTLGLLQPFYAGSREGWALAVERSSAWHAGDDAAGFEAEARALGEVTGRLHLALAEALPTRVAGAADEAELVAGRQAELAQTIDVAPELAELRGPIEATMGQADLAGQRLQRIHGDYHLGQVLRAADGHWVILDFEGEPARPLAQRRRPDSVLRDVAGMLRSFDYAAFQPLLADGGDPDGAAEARAAAWARAARAAFMAGWLATRGGTDAPAGLAGFELDKALYEVRYEVRYRPGWLPVPLGGIRRLLAASSTADHATMSAPER